MANLHATEAQSARDARSLDKDILRADEVSVQRSWSGQPRRRLYFSRSPDFRRSPGIATLDVRSHIPNSEYCRRRTR